MSTYSFLDVNASIVGPGGSSNLANGAAASEEGISITPTGEINAMTIGADGKGMHSLSADKSGSATVSLLKTSPQNKVLSQMYALQTASGAAHGQNTIVVTNRQSGDVITLQQVAFKKAPDLKYAKEGGTVEWEFDVVEIDRSLGDNS